MDRARAPEHGGAERLESRTPVNLLTKFNLMMLIAFAIGLSAAAVLNFALAEENARRDVIRQAALIAAQSNAVAQYTREEIRPLLSGPDQPVFNPQSVPFWVVQNNFKRMQKDFPDYSYKNAALNPTNPADRAVEWEADIIHGFRKDPTLKEQVTVRDGPAGKIFTVAKPIRISDQGCLVCHSVPANAPPAMIELYGPANGFGWQMGETVGAQLISVPMSVPMERARQAFLASIGGLTVIFLVMLVLMNLLLYFVIVRPVRKIAGMANDVSMGQMDTPEFKAAGHDEIASLAESFNRMRRSLANALKLLGE
jgi:HAMP domain-containing protein